MMDKKILVVDDALFMRAMLKKILKDGGFDYILEALDGEEACRIYEDEKPDLVLMDISMPEMNGAEAAEQIRRLDEGCVIIFLTAYDEFSYAKRALVIRALDYLLKPCEEDELVAVMEEAVRLAGLYAQGRQAGYFRPAGPENAQVRDGEERGESGENRMTQVAASILDYIRRNYMKEISMQDAARAMNYSDAYFCKLFKQCFDQNFTTYLTHFRMNEAKRLLQNQEMNVKDVSALVGYSDSNYFSKVFKRITGMIPSEFRDSQFVQK